MNLDQNFDVFATACVWLSQILIQVNKPNYMSPLLVTEQAGGIWSLYDALGP